MQAEMRQALEDAAGERVGRSCRSTLLEYTGNSVQMHIGDGCRWWRRKCWAAASDAAARSSQRKRRCSLCAADRVDARKAAGERMKEVQAGSVSELATEGGVVGDGGHGPADSWSAQAGADSEEEAAASVADSVTSNCSWLAAY
jgi:hypothetical protein